MRVPGSWSLLMAACFMSSLAGAQPAPPPAPEPAPPEPPAAESAPESPAASPEPTPAPAAAPAAPVAPASAPSLAPAAPSETGPKAPLAGEAPTDFTRDFSALPLTLEARLGFNARLGSSFDDAAEEEHFGAHYAFASYLAWKREFALGLELDHSGLGRVRALSGQTSVDNEYTVSGAWLGARVFPIRAERLDVFVNLRVGLLFQHVNALGTRESASITEPAQSYSCSEWDAPGFGLGGALGLAYRLGRHIAFVSRVDLTGARLSSDHIGTCADGIGSVASLSGSVGLAYEFETAPK